MSPPRSCLLCNRPIVPIRDGGRNTLVKDARGEYRVVHISCKRRRGALATEKP